MEDKEYKVVIVLKGGIRTKELAGGGIGRRLKFDKTDYCYKASRD